MTQVRFPKRREDGTFTVLAHFSVGEQHGIFELIRSHVAAWIRDHSNADLASEFSEDPRVTLLAEGQLAIVFEGRSTASKMWKDWAVLLTKDVSDTFPVVRFVRFDS